jgi:hypothetical protein
MKDLDSTAWLKRWLSMKMCEDDVFRDGNGFFTVSFVNLANLPVGKSPLAETIKECVSFDMLKLAVLDLQGRLAREKALKMVIAEAPRRIIDYSSVCSKPVVLQTLCGELQKCSRNVAAVICALDQKEALMSVQRTPEPVLPDGKPILWSRGVEGGTAVLIYEPDPRTYSVRDYSEVFEENGGKKVIIAVRVFRQT